LLKPIKSHFWMAYVSILSSLRSQSYSVVSQPFRENLYINIYASKKHKGILIFNATDPYRFSSFILFACYVFLWEYKRLKGGSNMTLEKAALWGLQNLSCDNMDKVGRTCSTHGKCVEIFSWKGLKEETLWRLKRKQEDNNKIDNNVWTGFIWLRIKPSDRHLWIR
jgi:hypothetical protein